MRQKTQNSNGNYALRGQLKGEMAGRGRRSQKQIFERLESHRQTRSHEEISLSDIKRRLRSLDPQNAENKLKRAFPAGEPVAAADLIQAQQRGVKFGRRKKPGQAESRRRFNAQAQSILLTPLRRVDYNDEARKLFKALNLEQGFGIWLRSGLRPIRCLI